MSTIRDVARAAGVSIATVSRVYTGSSAVSEDTGRRVLAAAARLDYWPNAAARSLTTSRTHTLGVLLPDLYGEFYSEVIRGIDEAARDARYQVLVSGSHADAETLVFVGRSLRGRVDGLIIMAPDVASSQAIAELMRSYPVVLLNAPSSRDLCDTISIANFEGAHTLVRHLIGLGHTRIAALLGPTGNNDAEDRRKGYKSALHEAGLNGVPPQEVRGDFTEASGYQAAEALLALSPRPTAVFALNDYMAIGLLGALNDRGVRVPQDLAVAGFDDIAVSRYLSPPLTTVHVDAHDLGRRAVQQWLLGVQGVRDRAKVHEVLPTKLVVRGSCGWRPRAEGSGQTRLVSPTRGKMPGARRKVAAPAGEGRAPGSMPGQEV